MVHLGMQYTHMELGQVLLQWAVRHIYTEVEASMLALEVILVDLLACTWDCEAR